MYRNNHQYSMALSRGQDDPPLLDLAIDPDLTPVAEAALFDALRNGRPINGQSSGVAIIEPLFSTGHDPECVAGLSVRIGEADDPVRSSTEFPLTFFEPLAHEASTTLLERGILKKGEFFHYRVYARPAIAVPRPAGRFTIEAEEPSLHVQPRSLPDLLARSILFGRMLPQDPPLFVAWSAFQDMARMARQAIPNECGGILAGHVCRDESVPEVFVVITAVIPAASPKSELTRFHFNSEVWTLLRNELEQRGQNEDMIGWFHSHAFLHKTCDHCAKALGRNCAASTPFLSEDDLHLHRLVFPRAYSVALLASDAPCTGLSIDAFGWRQARVARRGYHVLDIPALNEIPPSEHGEGVDHAR